MSFEDFDSKLRQAAEQHHPHYDEKAWSKMEKLLNRELPEKKDDNRKIFLLLLFLLLVGGGLWLTIAHPWETKTGGIATKQSVTKEQQRNSNESPASAITPPSNDRDATTIPAAQGSGKDDQQVTTIRDSPNATKLPTITDNSTSTAINGSVPTQADSEGKKKNIAVNGNRGDAQFEHNVTKGKVGSKPKSTDKNSSIIGKDDSKKDIAGDPGTTTTNASTPNQQESNKASITDKTVLNNPPAQGITNASDAGSDKQASASMDAIADDKKSTPEKAATKAKVKKPNTFFFSLSIGPDVSSVGFDNPGKVTLLKGAGFGYTIKDRWTVRTGFYSVSKIYTASPEQYKPTNAPPNPYFLKSIAADCDIYEIPLSLSYQWGRSAKQKTFVSAGLSSFIMKSEAYKYKYMYPGSTIPSYYTHLEKNQNKHLFSVMSLSGGYQRRINNTFSLSVEPYIKLPLSGIGYGKIKLNSAGVMVSVQASPFR
ncbi:MAG: hypothetical protein H7Y42_13315 [Chitinophagaceae bacterium]|nr:hypothetical protein [Chitinophagaceae bacterium]